MAHKIRAFVVENDLRSVLDLFERLSEAGAAETLDEGTIDAAMKGPGSAQERHLVVSNEEGTQAWGWAAVDLEPGASRAHLRWAVDPVAEANVGHGLLDAVLARASEAGAESLLAYISPGDAKALALFGANGAQRVSGYLRLRGELSRLRSAPRLPPGWRIVPGVGAEGAELSLEAARAAWSDLPGHNPASFESVMQAIQAFGPDGNLVAVDGSGRAVGIVRFTGSGPEDGYVDAPGLAPEVRSYENYAALLAEALSRLVARGAVHAVLESWGDPSEARKAQEDLGWEVEAHFEGRLFLLERTSQEAAEESTELYTPERKAEFLLANAVDHADFLAAREAVLRLGVDPDDGGS